MVDLPAHAPFDDAQKQKIRELSMTLTPQQASWFEWLFCRYFRRDGCCFSYSFTEKSHCSLWVRNRAIPRNLRSSSSSRPSRKDSSLPLRIWQTAKVADLKDAGSLLVVVSTWGDGEPPEAAEVFYNELMAAEDISLDGVEFSVCALGDTSYDQFCQTGKDVDARLEKLGAITPY